MIATRARRRLHALFVLLAAASAVACGDAASRDGEGAPASEPGAAERAMRAPGDTGCVKEGDWAICSVEDRLERAGLVVERLREPASHPFFAVEGVAYRIGAREDEVQVFVYPTPADRRRDTDALDSATVSPKGSRVAWSAPPTLIMSNNLAAVVLSLNERTIERLALALGAGLPQPEGQTVR